MVKAQKSGSWLFSTRLLPLQQWEYSWKATDFIYIYSYSFINFYFLTIVFFLN